MIELIDFTKRYGDLLAVDQLNLKIAQGEMFGFIGPNGAGKSTTIRFLATLLKPTAGEGIVNGHRVTAASDFASWGAPLLRRSSPRGVAREATAASVMKTP
jgi:ABC-type multidrug transport system ATPase subunit